MDILIRSVRLEDATSINEMRRMDGVTERILWEFSVKGLRRRRILGKGLTEGDHLFVAEVDENG